MHPGSARLSGGLLARALTTPPRARTPGVTHPTSKLEALLHAFGARGRHRAANARAGGQHWLGKNSARPKFGLIAEGRLLCRTSNRDAPCWRTCAVDQQHLCGLSAGTRPAPGRTDVSRLSHNDLDVSAADAANMAGSGACNIVVKPGIVAAAAAAAAARARFPYLQRCVNSQAQPLPVTVRLRLSFPQVRP